MPFTQTPTWMLLMPSVAVGLAIYSMDEMPRAAQAFAITPVATPSAVEEPADFYTSAPLEPVVASPAPPAATTTDKAWTPRLFGPQPTRLSRAFEGPYAEVAFSSASRRRVAKKAGTVKKQAPGALAKFEPRRGVYLGAAVDAAAANGDPQVLGGLMRDWNQRSGRKHALQLAFVQFPSETGQFPSFDADPRGWLAPRAFCEAADENGAAAILTLEPFQKPEQFSRGWQPGSKAYEATKNFAQGVGAWRKPVFIRWAHEMNGSWYPWSEWNDKNENMRRDPGEETGFTPADYRASYRNVAAMFRRYAPNAALVWCPNSGLLGGARRDVFKPFYPGDDVVDWVGLDIYERGWTGPNVGAKLWGGQFAHNLTHDMMDDESTKANESINFYKTYAQGKRKPLMLAETSATLSFRTDLDKDTRGAMNNDWKAAYWNPNEYGWMHGVYGTSTWSQNSGQGLLHPIDTRFPQLKAIVWFQLAKQEWIPVERTRNGRKTYQWFRDAYTDYRIGGGVEKGAASMYESAEIELYRELTGGKYFLPRIGS
jgi:hypothetical protein